MDGGCRRVGESTGNVDCQRRAKRAGSTCPSSASFDVLVGPPEEENRLWHGLLPDVSRSYISTASDRNAVVKTGLVKLKHALFTC